MARVLFVMETLGGGGAEKVMRDLLATLDRRRFQLQLAVVQKGAGGHSPCLPEDVIIHDLNARRTRFAIWPLARLLAKVRPDVVLSSDPYVDVLVTLSSRLSGVRCGHLIRGTNFLSLSLAENGFVARQAVRAALRASSGIVALTARMRDDLRANWAGDSKRIEVIPNPVNLEEIERLQAEAVDHRWLSPDREAPVIVAVGRLEPQKGFECLLKAFAQVLDVMDARLLIIGRGGQRDRLHELAAELGILPKVELLGWQSNPYSYVARADVFALSSLWEGFPNVMVEAMATGTPVVAASCASGPDEIVQDRVTGLLVSPGVPAEMAESILSLLANREYAQRLACNALQTLHRFNPTYVAGQYEALIDWVVERTTRGSGNG